MGNVWRVLPTYEYKLFLFTQVDLVGIVIHEWIYLCMEYTLF